MAGQTKQSTRNRKIEPLNWADTANAPALKGMVSFLDIHPDEVRSGHFKDVPPDPDPRLNATGDTLTGSESLTDLAPLSTSPAGTVIEMRPKLAHGLLVDTGTQAPPPHSERKDAPVSDSLKVSYATPHSDPLPVSESPTQARFVIGSIPSQNRKIRKCRLSQDAHSAGEETLYKILWDEGKPEKHDPQGSRVVRIGYAELANRARMHKVNVRLNLASLSAKLAIEQSGDFNSREMLAKTYRVLSYKEILERRRAAGLEYVIRQKNVVFVTDKGQPIPLAGLLQKGKAAPSRSRSPKNVGDDTNAPSTAGEAGPISDSTPISESMMGADLEHVSKVLNAYWSADDAAALQLIHACRAVRADAKADEIAFFVSEKAEMTRANRAIHNPVGLILRAVPQCFEGYSFDAFRERRRQSIRLAEAEKARKAEDDLALKEWMIRDAHDALANPLSSEESRRRAEEVLAFYRGIKHLILLSLRLSLSRRVSEHAGILEGGPSGIPRKGRCHRSYAELGE